MATCPTCDGHGEGDTCPACPHVPAVPDPTVEALRLTAAERDEVVLRFYDASTSEEAIETVERILAAHAAAPDALRVRVEALAGRSSEYDDAIDDVLALLEDGA